MNKKWKMFYIISFGLIEYYNRGEKACKHFSTNGYV